MSVWIAWVPWAAAALGLIVLQTTLGGATGVLGLHPDLLLLSVLLVGMRRGETTGAFWGILLGFIQDVFSAGVPGLNLFSKGLVGFTAGALRDQLDCENPNTQSLVAVTATLAEGGMHLALLQVFSATREPLAALLHLTLPAAVAHGVLLPCWTAWHRAAARRWRRLHRRFGTAVRA